MDARNPTFTFAAQQGERGVNLVSSVFFDHFGWLFKRNHQEHDFGIDGQVEVVTPSGEVTGQLLAVQIKFGSSFFKERTPIGYVFRGDPKHFNYLANYPLPVLIVLCHPESRICHWVKFDPLQTQAAGKSWKITVPFENDLSRSKHAIEALLPTPSDHGSELEEYWALNNLFFESGYIHFVVDKHDIETRDLARPRSFFDRLRVTKELALACQGKLELSVDGYDTDSRELFEIPEVRKYMQRLSRLLPELFYFVRTEAPTATLRTFALCHTKVWWPDGRSTREVTRRVEYKTAPVADFLRQGYAGLNEVTDWLNLPIEENKRISVAVGTCLGLPSEAFEPRAGDPEHEV